MAVRFIRSGAYFIIRDSVTLVQVLRKKREVLTFTETFDDITLATDYVFSYDPIVTTEKLKGGDETLDLQYAFSDILDEYGVAFPTQADCTKFLDETFFFNLNETGSTATESFYPESNTSFLLSGASSANIKRMITNEGYRDMYISYTDPSVAGQFVTFEPNDPPWQEKEYNGDIYGIFKYNPNGNATTETVFITTVAAFSLSILYLTLKNEAVTNVTFPAFTNLTTIEPGIYSQVGAVTPTGTITLDGDNQANPVFIFRTDGALTISANCEFILTNGATADNVYFVADGAVTLGADSICFGNFIGLVAVTVGVDCILNGRALSLGGAVDSSGDCYVSLPPPASAYDLGYLLNFALFTSSGALSNVGASNIIVGNVGTNLGAITGFTGMNITGEVYDNTSEIEIELLNGGARVVTITA
ncbi:MAG: hypothetical protein ACI9N9_000100 [Enterobacterales bacterium]|jgi:hypothetical protein